METSRNSTLKKIVGPQFGHPLEGAPMGATENRCSAQFSSEWSSISYIFPTDHLS